MLFFLLALCLEWIAPSTVEAAFIVQRVGDQFVVISKDSGDVKYQVSYVNFEGNEELFTKLSKAKQDQNLQGELRKELLDKRSRGLATRYYFDQVNPDTNEVNFMGLGKQIENFVNSKHKPSQSFQTINAKFQSFLRKHANDDEKARVRRLEAHLDYRLYGSCHVSQHPFLPKPDNYDRTPPRALVANVCGNKPSCISAAWCSGGPYGETGTGINVLCPSYKYNRNGKQVDECNVDVRSCVKGNQFLSGLTEDGLTPREKTAFERKKRKYPRFERNNKGRKVIRPNIGVPPTRKKITLNGEEMEECRFGPQYGPQLAHGEECGGKDVCFGKYYCIKALPEGQKQKPGPREQREGVAVCQAIEVGGIITCPGAIDCIAEGQDRGAVGFARAVRIPHPKSPNSNGSAAGKGL